MTKSRGATLHCYREDALIGQVRSVTPIGSARKVKNVTRWGAVRQEYELGAHVGNEVELVLATDVDDPSRSALYADFEAGDPVTFDFLQDAGLLMSFPALVVQVSDGYPLDGLVTFKARLRIVAPGLGFTGVHSGRVQLGATAAIEVEGSSSTTARAAALSATAQITAAGHNTLLQRAVGVSATAQITVVGLHGNLVLGAVGLSATANITVAGGVGGVKPYSGGYEGGY